ncbi:MAG TPA: thioredoxin-like domain-containing protein [Pyrinomonadaceae bacterium]|nr:thioredoxin-like domain-containing protein [Pyrinomonadaceae bacterium]
MKFVSVVAGLALVSAALYFISDAQTRTRAVSRDASVPAFSEADETPKDNPDAAPTPAPDGPKVALDTLLDARSAPQAPAFAEGSWVNSDPLTPESLRGRVVLVDFWTFGCYNCRNTLPTLKRFHERYGGRGLTVVGVHSPESDREKDILNVRRQVRSLGLRYAVVTDNDYRTWTAYAIDAWPTVVILDKRGRIRYKHVGEGRYEQQEEVIRTLLAE